MEERIKIFMSQLRVDKELLQGTAKTYNKMLIKKLERMFPELIENKNY